MKRRAWCRALLGLCVLTMPGAFAEGPGAKGRVLYVATNGNDAWSGGLAEPNAAGTDGPLQTIAVARDRIRAARASAAAPSTVLIRGGRYEISEPIVFTPEDSGRAGQLVVYSAYARERPVISGGRRITGWTKGSGNVWTAEVPEARSGKWRFHQLFVNGRRAVRARSPNKGFFRIDGPKSTARPFQFKYKAGDINPSWAEPGDVEVIALFAWAEVRRPIRQVKESARIATLAGPANTYNPEANARYYIENAPDALDAAGEWYLGARSGIVSYWPRAREDMSRIEVIAPVVTRLVRFDGEPSAGRLVRHIVLRGLTFQDADWDLGPDGYADVQAAVEIGGALKMTGAADCLIEKCTISRVEGYALDVGFGSKRNRITGNRIFDIGAGGIKLGWGKEGLQPPHTPGGYVVYDNEAELNGENLVTDNHIFNLGNVFPSAAGIWVGQSIGSTVSHNHIHDLNYSAISVGWNWAYGPHQCHHNVIEYNHIHHVGRGVLSDLGAIYTLGIQPGTVIRNNLIHDVWCFNYGGSGIYTDEGSSGIVIENNVIYRTESAAFTQHYGRNNTVRNNIFAFSKDYQINLSRREDHVSLIFERNIVYWNEGVLFGGNWSGSDATPPCGPDSASTDNRHPEADCRHFRSDGNIYYDERGGTPAFANGTFEEWQKRGNDVKSSLADPRFAAVQLYNFALLPGSPALKMGFKPIDLSRLGPRPGRLPDENVDAAGR